MFTSATDFVKSVDWSTLGTNIWNGLVSMISNIDWGGLVSKAFEFVGNVIKGGINFITGIATAIKETITQNKGAFGESGGEILAGIWEGIKNAISNAAQWAKDYIFTPIWEGICEVFGIASPAKEMEPLGGYIIDGLINGIGDIWDKIKEKFTAFYDKIVLWFDNRIEKFKYQGSKILKGIKDGVGNIWTSIKEKFSTFWTNLSSWFSGKAAGLVLRNKSTEDSIIFTLDGLEFFAADDFVSYSQWVIKVVLSAIINGTSINFSTRPNNHRSRIQFEAIQTKHLYCEDLSLFNNDSGNDVTLVNLRGMIESISAMQTRIGELETALGQQHTHTKASAVRENVVNATCESGGSYDSVIYCATCGEEISRTRITTDAIGHTDSNGDGYCDVCGAKVGAFYTITIRSNDTSMGTVLGSGSYLSGKTITITATAKSGYKFVQWNDGNTNDTRTIEVTGNATYTAYFEAVTSGEDEIIEGVSKAVSIPTKQEYVYIKFVPKYSGSYTFVSLDQTSLDPDGGVYPANKSSSLAGDTNSGGFSVTYDNFVAGTTYYLAVRLWSGTGTVNVRVDYNGSSSGGGSGETVQLYIVAAENNDEIVGSVRVKRNGSVVTSSTGNYTFNVGDSVTVEAIPYSGYVFTAWRDYDSGDLISDSSSYSFVVSSTSPNLIAVIY